MANPENDTKELITKQVIAREEKAKRDEVNRIKAEMARGRQSARTAEASTRRVEKLTQLNERGEPQDYMELAKHRANQIINSEFNSTMNWLSAMVNLLNMYSLLNKGIAGNLDMKVIFPAKILIVDHLFLGGIKDNLLIRPSKELQLPNMKYDMKYDPIKGLLISSLLKGSDDSTRLVNNLFKKGVHAFLNEKGYEQDPADSKKWLKKGTAEALDDATLQLLKADFKSYIEREEPKLNFIPDSTLLEEAPSTAPTPRPPGM